MRVYWRGMAKFSVNLASFAKTFPRGIAVPPLLEAFGQWVSKLPHGSLGYFEVMKGGKFADGALSRDANKQIADATAIFLMFGDGSELALWNHGDGPPAVVLIDSEGQHRTVASSLEAFLEACGRQDTDTELDGKYLDDAPPQRHKELAAWLRARKVKVAKRKAPDFGKWVHALAKVDAPPKASGLAPPPKDMAARAIAALGKPASDAKLAGLLAELGIDLKRYKTADSQRFLLVPPHGYALSFEAKKLKRVEFTNAGYVSWDYVNGKDAKFAAFPHEVWKGVKATDKLATALKKLGKPSDATPSAGLYYYKLPGGAQALVKGFDEDVDDDGIAKDALRYITIGVR